MKKEEFKFIFDMDGTLYSFGKNNHSYDLSPLSNAVRLNSYEFIKKEFQISRDEAIKKYNMIVEKYNGETSIGLEKEFGINRFEYFEKTWTMDPVSLIKKDEELSELLNVFQGKAALLTGAPKVWTDKVLQHLGLTNIFQNLIFTGEPDLRKPNPKIFQTIANGLGVPTSMIISIGDQLHTDIIPAKQIGMKTIHIGNSMSVADFTAKNIREVLLILKMEKFI